MTTPLSACLRLLRRAIPILLLACVTPMAAHAEEQYTLAQLKQLALQHHPALRASQAQLGAAQAGLTTALSYPNPDFEFSSGPLTPRNGGTGRGAAWGLGIAQPLDMPALREKRADLASANILRTEAGVRAVHVDLMLQVEAAYHDILRLDQAQQITLEDVELLMQVRDRVMLRVKVGEAANLDLIRAETEMLNANRIHETNILRLEQARERLRALVGGTIAGNFAVSAIDSTPTAPPGREVVWQEILTRNPELAQAQGGIRMAQAKLALEQQLRTPQVTVRGLFEQEPEMRNWRLGVSLPLPVWNQRQGQIREAAAGLNGAEALQSEKLLQLKQALNTAYSRYEIAKTQVNTYENGLLREAGAALRVAEAAYRFGERGILDYLDAQRTYRMVRLDYHTARYELISALVEISRLRAQELHGESK